MLSNVLLGHTRARAALKVAYYGVRSLAERKPAKIRRAECAVCGKRARFLYATVGFDAYWVDPLDETGFGVCCGSTNRNRAVALAIAQVLGHSDKSLREVVALGEFDIYVAAANGSIADVSTGGRTTTSEYFDGVPSGSYRDGILCQDLTDLSFEESKFDVVVSEHVFEHVNDPRKAVFEVARVLKPGGFFVLSIPFEAEGDSSVTRIEPDMTELLPRRYHKDPIRSEGALVFSDFSKADFVSEYLTPAGLEGSIVDFSDDARGVRKSPVVIGKKPLA